MCFADFGGGFVAINGGFRRWLTRNADECRHFVATVLVSFRVGLVERLESGDRVRNAHKPSFVQSSDGRVFVAKSGCRHGSS